MTAARAIQPRRTSLRTQSRRRWGRRLAAKSDERRIERPWQRRAAGRAGRRSRSDGRRPRQTAERAGERTSGVVLDASRAPRRRRQRRVGDTNWTDSSRKTIEARTRPMTLFAQMRRASTTSNGTGAPFDDARRSPNRDDVRCRPAMSPGTGTVPPPVGADQPRATATRTAGDRDRAARVRAVDEDHAVLVEQEGLREAAVAAQAPTTCRTVLGQSDVGLGEERVEVERAPAGGAPLIGPVPRPVGRRWPAPARRG